MIGNGLALLVIHDEHNQESCIYEKKKKYKKKK